MLSSYMTSNFETIAGIVELGYVTFFTDKVDEITWYQMGRGFVRFLWQKSWIVV